MPVLCSERDLLLRPLEESDVPRMARWRSDPAVLQFYCGRDRPLDEAGVRGHYLGRNDEPTGDEVGEYQACVVERGGRPVGFVQFYLLRRADAERFGYPSQERSFGVDLFIGETSEWGQGLGPRILELTCRHLLAERGARRIVADPRADNPRSLRALERAGFRRVRRLPRHEVFEGVPTDCWLMERP